MVQSANTTMNANLDEIREKFCDEITTHQTRTLGIIEYQKNEVAEKIAKLVAKVCLKKLRPKTKEILGQIRNGTLEKAADSAQGQLFLLSLAKPLTSQKLTFARVQLTKGIHVEISKILLFNTSECYC